VSAMTSTTSMTAIDYAALAERLKEHAALHDSLAAHSDEQRVWADDLRTFEAMVRGMAKQELVGWIITNGIEVPLYLHPAPQPQPAQLPKCGCRSCLTPAELLSTFVVCPKCGNKRCPKADDHRNACTDSNAPGQAPQPERQSASEPTDRCKHGVRFPHECRECEAEPSIEKIQRWRESEGLTEREPQPEPIDPHMIAAEDRYPDAEAQQGGWTYSHPHWSKCGFDDLVNSIVANAVAFYRDTRDAFRSDVIDALHRAQEIAMQGREPTEAQIEQHPDDAAVDRFAAAMKAKLAEKRAEGRGGWDDPAQCSTGFLARLLREHVEKGDPLDVGNFAMMLWNRGGATNEENNDVDR